MADNLHAYTLATAGDTVLAARERGGQRKRRTVRGSLPRIQAPSSKLYPALVNKKPCQVDRKSYSLERKHTITIDRYYTLMELSTIARNIEIYGIMLEKSVTSETTGLIIVKPQLFPRKIVAPS